MKTEEAKFVDRFTFRLEKHYMADVTRIESSTMSGIFDLSVIRLSRAIWVEAKIRNQKKVLLRPPQWAWGHRRSAHGDRMFVVAWDPQIEVYFVWKFPGIIGEPSSKYVKIISDPHFTSDHIDDNMVTFLFT